MKAKNTTRRRFLKISGWGTLAAAMWKSIVPCFVSAATDETLALLGGLTWIKHAAFRLQDGNKIIYFDPYQLTSDYTNDADLILVSHSHGDHCDAASVSRILKDTTIILTEPESADKLKTLSDNITTMKPGDEIALEDLKVEAVPSYNTNKTNHPKSKNWLGFIVTLSDGRRFYHAGDTDVIPEMENIETDVALLPAGGTYTMNALEAAEAARIINPKVAVPMHYGSVVGSSRDGTRFEEAVGSEIPVMVFEPGQTIPPSPSQVRNWDRYDSKG